MAGMQVGAVQASYSGYSISIIDPMRVEETDGLERVGTWFEVVAPTTLTMRIWAGSAQSSSLLSLRKPGESAMLSVTTDSPSVPSSCFCLRLPPWPRQKSLPCADRSVPARFGTKSLLHARQALLNFFSTTFFFPLLQTSLLLTHPRL